MASGSHPQTPAELPSFPVAALGAVILSVAVGLVGADLLAGRAIRRIDVLAALRER